jgi:hypothetical protein
VGGFKTLYKGGLSFITSLKGINLNFLLKINYNSVRGAGHMVPQKKGFEILHAIESFMADKNF